jgi:phosphatidylinositol kinase/protein kinase (PI-3  family)
MSQNQDLLQSLFLGLRSTGSSDEARISYSIRITRFVSTSLATTAIASSSVAYQAVTTLLQSLVSSNDSGDKSAATFLLLELSSDPLADDSQRALRLAYFVRQILTHPVTDSSSLQRAARCIGIMAKSLGTQAAEFVELESKRAIEWLQSGSSTMGANLSVPGGEAATKIPDQNDGNLRLAAVFVLKELAKEVPTFYYQYVSSFYANIWFGLRDSNVEVREASANAVAICLSLITSRRNRNRDSWITTLYSTIRSILSSPVGETTIISGSLNTSVSTNASFDGITFGDAVTAGFSRLSSLLTSGVPSSIWSSPWADSIHGALLCLIELLASSAALPLDSFTNSFLMPRFNEMCDSVLKYRESKNKFIRRCVIILLTRLAHFHPESFVRLYADSSLAFLLVCLKDPKLDGERGVSLVAVGRISLAIGGYLASDALRPKLDRIIDCVRAGMLSGPAAPRARATIISSNIGSVFLDTSSCSTEALTCFAMIARAVGPALTDHCHMLIDPMFSSGLSDVLIEALIAISNDIPALKPLFQERLLNEISMVLAGRPFSSPHIDPVHLSALTHGAGFDQETIEENNEVRQLPNSAMSPGTRIQAAFNAYGRLPVHFRLPRPSQSGDSSNRLSISSLVNILSDSVGSMQKQKSLLGASGGISVPDKVLNNNSSSSTMNNSSSWSQHLSSSGFEGKYLVTNKDRPTSRSSGDNTLGSGRIMSARARGVPSDIICLSLRTLALMDFSGIPLIPFVREVVVLHLDDDDPIVRLEAAVTCTRLLIRPSEILAKDSMNPLDVIGIAPTVNVDSSGNDDDSDADDDYDLGNDISSSKYAEDGVVGYDVIGPVSIDPKRLKTHSQCSHSVSHRNGIDVIVDKKPRHPYLLYSQDVLGTGTLGMGDFISPVTTGARPISNADETSVLSQLINQNNFHDPNPKLVVISQMLSRLVMMCITDPDPAVRLELLRCLDYRFDPLLIEHETLRLLIAGLQDENFACREATMSVLGRLASQNPSIILPAMRRSLVSLLSELEYADAHPDLLSIPVSMTNSSTRSTSVRDTSDPQSISGLSFGLSSSSSSLKRQNAYFNGISHDVLLVAASSGGGREHAARMIGLLIRSAQKMILPYVPVLLRALLPYTLSNKRVDLSFGESFDDASKSLSSSDRPELLTTSVLAAIGELSAINASSITPFVHLLVPVLVDGLSQAAHALGVGSGATTNSATLEAVLGHGQNSREVGGRVKGGASLKSTRGTMLSSAGIPNHLPRVGLASGIQPALFVTVAVRTLGLIAENTGTVIAPYVDHPHLLQLLLVLLVKAPKLLTPVSSSFGYAASNIPQSVREDTRVAKHQFSAFLPDGILAASGWPLRREVLRTIGILGALDPYRLRMAQISQIQRAAAAHQAAVQARLLAVVATAHANGQRLAASKLSPESLRTGVLPGAFEGYLPLFMDKPKIAAVNEWVKPTLVVPKSDGTTGAGGPWDLTSSIPRVLGIAVGSGIEVDPMEAALAGLAGEPGAYVGVNIDEVGLGMGSITGIGGRRGGQGADALGFGLGFGVDGLLPGASATEQGNGGAHKNEGSATALFGKVDIFGNTGMQVRGAQAPEMAIETISTPASAILPAMVPNAEDFAPTVALSALLAIVRDDSDVGRSHQSSVLQAIMLVLRSLGSLQRCSQFLPLVVPVLLSVFRNSTRRLVESAFERDVAVVSQSATAKSDQSGIDSASAASQTSLPASPAGNDSPSSGSASDSASCNAVLEQLTVLVLLVRGHMRPWLPATFSIIRELWPACLPMSLTFVEAVASALGDETKTLITTLIPHFLSILAHDGSRPVLSPTPSAERYAQGPIYGVVVDALPSGGLTGLYIASDGLLAVSNQSSSSSGNHHFHSPSPGRLLTRHVLHSIAVLVCGGRKALSGGHRHLLDDHFEVLIPSICRLIDAGIPQSGAKLLSGEESLKRPSPWATVSGFPSNSSSLFAYGGVLPVVRRQAIDTISTILSSGVNLAPFAARIIQPLARTISDEIASSTPLDVKKAAVDCLCLLILQIREDYVVWIPTIKKACHIATLAAKGDGQSSTNSASNATPVNDDTSIGISGTGQGSVIPHDTYEKLISLLLGRGTGYGFAVDDDLSLFGYGPPQCLPTNPVDLANLLYDRSTCGRDGSGPRLAAALSVSNTTAPSILPQTGSRNSNSAAASTILASNIASPLGEVFGDSGLMGTLTHDFSSFFVEIEPPQRSVFGSTGGGASSSAYSGLVDAFGSSGQGDLKMPVNQEAMKRAWETSARSTKEDWTEWMRRLSVNLLRESPSRSLRACCPLAQVHPPLASELFNAAFIILWGELFDENQQSLLMALEAAFISPSIPMPILQQLLNLAEFMDHNENSLPIDIRRLGQLSEKVGAFAKALHYKEVEFHAAPGDSSTIESLISINNQLDEPEAAIGILKSIQQDRTGRNYGSRASHSPSSIDMISSTTFSVEMQESWYEKLGRWEDALAAYERRQVSQPDSLVVVLGRMRCLRALGEWNKLDALARDAWPRLPTSGALQKAGSAAISTPSTSHMSVASLAARSAWALSRWSDLEHYLHHLPESSLQGAFYRAVLAVHDLRIDDAAVQIDRARKVLSGEIAVMMGETYSRAYRHIVTVQQLSEMEEILTYLRLVTSGDDKGASTYAAHMRKMWTLRIRGVSRSVDMWIRILSVRSLVTMASENMHEWLQFSSLCRRTHRFGMAFKVLVGLGMCSDTNDLRNPLDAGDSMRKSDSRSFSRNSENKEGGRLIEPFETEYTTSEEDVEFANPLVGVASAAHPRVTYAYLKHLWYTGHREKAVEQLKELTKRVDESVMARRLATKKPTETDGVKNAKLNDQNYGLYGRYVLEPNDEIALRVQCHLRLGQWSEGLIEPIVADFTNSTANVSIASALPTASTGAKRLSSQAYAELVSPILDSFRISTHDCGERGFSHYRAWHAWAFANFSAAEYYADNLQNQRVSSSNTFSPSRIDPLEKGAPPIKDASSDIQSVITTHAVNAAKAFFRSIALGRTRLKAYILQDLLRLLTIWFHFGGFPAVHSALSAGLDTGSVSSDVWIQVIPQLIARIHVAGRRRRSLLLLLLRRIGASHPQALIYPITVAVKSEQNVQSNTADAVMTSLRSEFPTLVAQADVVSNELIRVAILWPELWHSALEEASRVFFGEGNERSFLELLLPLHEKMKSPGPQTQREVHFIQQYGRELDTACSHLLTYKRRLDSGENKSDCAGDAAAAWDCYYSIFRKINKSLNTEMALDLPIVSPRLLAAHDLELSVPGTYTAGSPIVRIMALCPNIEVIASKQRPRKITMQGSDGRQYTFLLKGHEDLRQDERVMQLFGLINTLILNNYETSRRDLSIRRYAVTPLSHSAGVVGWVPNTDTFHVLVREHRQARKVLLNVEHRIMCQMAPMYDHLTVLQKVEVFRHALDSTEGEDLAKVLLLKSTSTEVWLERRTNYMRSLAVMSIVGYILGLGDRHPSNLLLDRISGKILHIDFGDCFETAMTREKFPERVPFRLTRMLIKAMEACGIEGSYRATCEAVVRVLRLHRDSVIAMLEAFVHDPLINWRLLGNAGNHQTNHDGNNSQDVLTSSKVSKKSSTKEGPQQQTVVAGVSSLVGHVDSVAARSLVQRGLDISAEIESNNVATSAFASGVDLNGAQTSTAINNAIRNSIATSVRVRERSTVRHFTPQISSSSDMMHARRGYVDTFVENIEDAEDESSRDALNERAIAVLRRVQAKLTGRDFSDDDPIGHLMMQGVGAGKGVHQRNEDNSYTGHKVSTTLDVAAQVQRLVLAASSYENLSVSYTGWCSFW